MKKLSITLISIFVLINIAFAQQTTQQKIDSLKNEKAKADQALAQANDYKSVEAAKAKQVKVSAELNTALTQQKQEAEAAAAEKARKEAAEKAKKAAEERERQAAEKKAQDAKLQQAKDNLYNKYPEYLDTVLEPFLIEKFKADPNFLIKDIRHGKPHSYEVPPYYAVQCYTGGSPIPLASIYINNEKAYEQPWNYMYDYPYEGANGMLQAYNMVMDGMDRYNYIESVLAVYKRIDLWNNDPALMKDYRKILRAHYKTPGKIRATIKEKIGPDYNYTDYIPVKCEHTLYYVDKKDVIQNTPTCNKTTCVNVEHTAYSSGNPSSGPFNRGSTKYKYTKPSCRPTVRGPIGDQIWRDMGVKDFPEKLIMVDDKFSAKHETVITTNFSVPCSMGEAIESPTLHYKKDTSSYWFGTDSRIGDERWLNIDCNMKDFKDYFSNTLKSKKHAVKRWVIPDDDDHKCSQTMSKVAKYGL